MYKPATLPPPGGPYNTDVPSPEDFTPDELLRQTLGQYYHGQSQIAGHVFELFHQLGKNTR